MWIKEQQLNYGICEKCKIKYNKDETQDCPVCRTGKPNNMVNPFNPNKESWANNGKKKMEEAIVDAEQLETDGTSEDSEESEEAEESAE